MSFRFSSVGLALWLALPAAHAESPSLEQAGALEAKGDFNGAAGVLTQALALASLAQPERKEIGFELDRLERVRKDYPFTKDELFAALKKSVRDVTEVEFERWVAEGRFDSRNIDGERRFMGSSVSNLYFRYPELNSRRVEPKDPAQFEQTVLIATREIANAAYTEQKPYVLPKRFRVTMTVTAASNATPAGEIIRAWLPIPRRYPFQKDFKLRQTSSRVKHLEAETSSIRSVFLEQQATKNKPTEFKIEYDYTAYGVRIEVAPEKVRGCDPNVPALLPFLREAPHVVFTPEMRALSQQIVGGETNAYLKARKFYQWITGNIRYSYALEYSTIRNLGEYCRAHGYGDCGQEALLFITLCRLNGIPARWQSGWFTFPGGKTIHDWVEIYLPPYGWMPVDPYMGIWAMRYVHSLSDDEKREVRDFYFGGLDQWRMAANSDHSQALTPPKQSLRSDTVDFQRGELERGTNNIYFDQYSYKLDVTELRSK